MVRPRGGRRSAGRQRVRGALVRPQAHPGRAGPVHGVTDQRVAEPEAARDLRGPDQVLRDQLVERRQRLGLGHRRGRDREVELERVPRDGRGLREAAGRRGQRVELAEDRRGDRLGHTGAVGLRRRPVLALGQAGELQQVERVAAAGLVEALGPAGRRPADQAARVRGRERAEREVQDGVAADRGPVDRVEQRPVGLPGAIAGRDHDAGPRRVAQQVRHELERGAVGPVEVVEHEDQRPPRGQALEQLADRPVGTEALRGGRRAVRAGVERAQGWEDRRELGQVLGGHAAERARVQRLEVLVQGVDEEAEGELALELRGAPVEGQAAAVLRPRERLGQQGGLPDPGLARDERESRRARIGLVQERREAVQLAVTADEGLGSGHGAVAPGRA